MGLSAGLLSSQPHELTIRSLAKWTLTPGRLGKA